jgi:hypothetical protein
VSLKLKDALRATGRVTVNDGFAACASRVPVKIQKRASGTWKTIKSVKTRRNGSYRSSLPDNAGKYRALAPAVRAKGDRCVRAVSRTRRHE